MVYTKIFKIGGAILENKNAISSTMEQLFDLINKRKRSSNLIIIPGGGSYANFIRYIDNKLELGEDLAHWEAIISMDKNAEILHQQFPSTVLVENFLDLCQMIKNESNDSQIFVFKPFNYLYKTDKLPHSWKITSDSIALHISFKLGLEQCFLIKKVDGIIDKEGNLIRELTVKEFMHFRKSDKLATIEKPTNILKELSTPVDPYCLQLIERYGISCIILNGASSHSRITQYFIENGTQYTIINPDQMI